MTEWPIEWAECADGECSPQDCQCVRFARMCEGYWIEATAKAVRDVGGLWALQQGMKEIARREIGRLDRKSISDRQQQEKT